MSIKLKGIPNNFVLLPELILFLMTLNMRKRKKVQEENGADFNLILIISNDIEIEYSLSRILSRVSYNSVDKKRYQNKGHDYLGLILKSPP